MKPASLSLLAVVLAAAGTPDAALAGSTVFSSGSGVAIVSGTSVVVGDVVVGKGPARTEERKAGAYVGLVLEAPVDMTYVVGKAPSLKVTAPANILPLVTTEVKGRDLIIGLKKSVTMDGMIRVEATGPTLEAIRMLASGDVKASGLASRKLALDISGSGSIAASGQADVLAVDVSGSGEIHADGLRSQEAALDVSGSGSVSVHAAKSVRIDLSGSGDITVAGNPRARSVDRSGAGEITFK